MVVERERERESYNLVKEVALIKDAQETAYVNKENCWTAWRESNILKNWGWQVCRS